MTAEAGASEEKSRKAAETLATNENRFNQLENLTKGGCSAVCRDLVKFRVDIIQSIAVMLLLQTGLIAVLVKLL